jgi:hypothetical protein
MMCQKSFSFSLFACLIVLVNLLFLSCKPKDYEELKQKGLATGKRYDELFLGLKFGDERNDFFAHCFKLNKEGVITNGPHNMSVLYVLPEHTEHKIDLNFYPDFCAKRICNIKATFNYQSWSPWAAPFHSEKLLPHAVKWLENQFETDLTKMKVGDKERLVAIDGNREIIVSLKDDQFVQVSIKDLTQTPDPIVIDSTDIKRALYQTEPDTR